MSNPSDLEFLRLRLERLEEMLNCPGEFEYAENGRYRYRSMPCIPEEYARIREQALFKKLLAQVKEGQVAKALQDWRKYLGGRLTSHREFYRSLQEAYDHWLSIPFPFRIDIPEPLHPPDLEIEDRQGNLWHVDDALLILIDDVVMRLEKWMASTDDDNEMM